MTGHLLSPPPLALARAAPGALSRHLRSHRASERRTLTTVSHSRTQNSLELWEDTIGLSPPPALQQRGPRKWREASQAALVHSSRFRTEFVPCSQALVQKRPGQALGFCCEIPSLETENRLPRITIHSDQGRTSNKQDNDLKWKQQITPFPSIRMARIQNTKKRT